MMQSLLACSRQNGFVKETFLLFPIQQRNKHHNRMSTENSIHFKLCSSGERNTTVKKSMHHIQLAKHGLRLENILTHNRSEITNDNPHNGAHFPRCEQRKGVKNRLCLVADSYVVYWQAKPIMRKLMFVMSCLCLSGLV